MSERGQPEEDFDEEGRKLFAALHLPSSGPGRPGCARYSHLDPIWGHPMTGAKLYIGNHVAAASRDILHEHRIRHIVNAQGPDTPNSFEKDASFRYLRFPIAMWRRAPNMSTLKGVLDFLDPLLTFISRALDAGHNVLVHCLAGAHRAGTIGVICLMYFARLDLPAALAAARRCRPAVQPIGTLTQLLHFVDLAFQDKAVAERAA